MEVAVTLSLGGNHAADTRGGAEQKIIPDKDIHDADDFLLKGGQKFRCFALRCQYQAVRYEHEYFAML